MTLYAVRPDPETGDPGEDSEVIGQSKDGWSFLDQTSMLWRLIDTQRADQVDAVMVRLNEEADKYDQLRIYPDALKELIQLIGEVEEEIIAAGIADQHWRVPPERLDELAKTVPAMDLKTDRSLQSKTSALGEVMINALSIRNFLKRALDEGCVVILG